MGSCHKCKKYPARYKIRILHLGGDKIWKKICICTYCYYKNINIIS